MKSQKGCVGANLFSMGSYKEVFYQVPFSLVQILIPDSNEESYINRYIIRVNWRAAARTSYIDKPAVSRELQDVHSAWVQSV